MWITTTTKTMNIQNDGGPAFARAGFTSEQTESQEGMSLRAYFAAHAPTQVADWFEARQDGLIPLPERDRKLQYCEGCKDESDCLGNADCQQLREFYIQDYNIRQENRKRRYIQWRWAYADAMIEEMHR